MLIPVLVVALCASTERVNASIISGQEPYMVTIGSGANVSYLAFDETTLGAAPVVYAWHYDGATNATGNPWSGSDLLQGVVDGSASTPFALSYTTGAYGLMASFSIGSETSTIDPLGSPVWTYWIKGGAQDAYNDSGDPFTVSPISWVVAPSNFDIRWLTNGSWDAWTLSSFSYTGATSDTSYYTDINGIVQPVSFGTYGGAAPLSAVPEAAPSGLFPLAALFLFLIRVLKSKSALKT